MAFWIEGRDGEVIDMKSIILDQDIPTINEEDRLAPPLEDNQLPDRPTVQEVARWLRKSPNTIYLWCRQGLIPHKVVGRSNIFDKAALIKWAKPNEAA
jgi:hypothetical protein